MEILSNQSFSRIEFIQRKYDEWVQYLHRFGMEPIRVYLSNNWYLEMIEEVDQRKKTGIFTEYVFADINKCRVYKTFPLIIVKDSSYFMVEGTIQRQNLPTTKPCNSQILIDINSTVMQ